MTRQAHDSLDTLLSEHLEFLALQNAGVFIVGEATLSLVDVYCVFLPRDAVLVRIFE